MMPLKREPADDEEFDVMYCLVDDEGRSLAFADDVTLVGTKDNKVTKFRKAVKKENPRKLATLDASDLQVYKNKETFQHKTPLDEESPVYGLGASKKEALIVVVRTLPCKSQTIVF